MTWIASLTERYFRSNTLEVIIYLSKFYIKPDQMLPKGDTLIHILIQSDILEGVEYFLHKGYDPNLRTKQDHETYPYCTLLHIAVANESIELTNILIDHGA